MKLCRSSLYSHWPDRNMEDYDVCGLLTGIPFEACG